MTAGFVILTAKGHPWFLISNILCVPPFVYCAADRSEASSAAYTVQSQDPTGGTDLAPSGSPPPAACAPSTSMGAAHSYIGNILCGYNITDFFGPDNSQSARKSPPRIGQGGDFVRPLLTNVFSQFKIKMLRSKRRVRWVGRLFSPVRTYGKSPRRKNSAGGFMFEPTLPRGAGAAGGRRRSVPAPRGARPLRGR